MNTSRRRIDTSAWLWILILTIIPLALAPGAIAQNTAPVLTTLHRFTGPPDDGASPESSLVFGADGALYGTTQFGGAFSVGTVFALAPPAISGGDWTPEILHSFGGPDDGQQPVGGVVFGANGVLYGATLSGGTSALAAGTVFELRPPKVAGSGWTERVLYNFTGSADGGFPEAGVVAAKSGALFGTTSGGGKYFAGTVFKLTPPAAGGAWAQTVLYDFTGESDGGQPFSPLAIGAGGALYGTTSDQIVRGYGAVFRLTPPGTAGGAWTENTLYTFAGGSDGAFPYAGVTIGKGGVLYGTTYQGGGADSGTVFSLAPPASPGSPWAETVLYRFTRRKDGANPHASLVIGEGGKLYGTTQYGGFEGPNCTGGTCGTVFRLTPPAVTGGAWTQTVLYRFSGGLQGEEPLAGLVIGSGGTFFGTTVYGGYAPGISGSGTVFELEP